jgi:hypothetical protein
VNIALQFGQGVDIQFISYFQTAYSEKDHKILAE